MAINRFSDSSIQEGFPKYTSLWDGKTAVSAMDSLGTFTVSSAVSSITFSNIPSTYKHLQIRGVARTPTNVSLGIRLNSDSGNNYSRHYLNTNGSTTGTGGNANTNHAYAGTASQTSNFFACNVIDILDYSVDTKSKCVRSISGSNQNGNGFIQFMSGVWRNNAIINTVTIIQVEGDNFQPNSTFALYGVK